MTEHTKEPWTVVDPVALGYAAPLVYGAGGDSLVAIAHGGGPKRAVDAGEARANVARIVACVNACAGISTEALESGALGALVESLCILDNMASDDFAKGADRPIRDALAKLKG